MSAVVPSTVAFPCQRILLGVAKLASMTLLAMPVFAQDITANSELAEGLATTEAFAKICVEEWPERASQFATHLAASQRCESADRAALDRARVSDVYRARYDTIVEEMRRMPDRQIRSFCETLLESRC